MSSGPKQIQYGHPEEASATGGGTSTGELPVGVVLASAAWKTTFVAPRAQMLRTENPAVGVRKTQPSPGADLRISPGLNLTSCHRACKGPSWGFLEVPLSLRERVGVRGRRTNFRPCDPYRQGNHPETMKMGEAGWQRCPILSLGRCLLVANLVPCN